MWVDKAKHQVKQIFKCNDGKSMKNYVGCKVERDSKTKTLKLTQPVMIQSF